MIYMEFRYVKELVQWLIWQGEHIAAIDSIYEIELAIAGRNKPTVYKLNYWAK